MAPKPVTPRRESSGRRRGRPPGTTNAARAARMAAQAAVANSEPPPKRRRYAPGGAGGGGHFIEVDEFDNPVTGALAASSGSRSRSRLNVSPLQSRKERSTRTRTATSRAVRSAVPYSSAAAVAAAVAQNEGYKPREEKGWEEFHPNLNIDAAFAAVRSDEVDGTVHPPAPPRSTTPLKNPNPASTGNTPVRSTGLPAPSDAAAPGPGTSTTPKRRISRPVRDSVSFYASRSTVEIAAATPKTPKVLSILPIHSQTPKERLDLKQPSYRKTNRVALFESKTFGQARYVDKAMANVGYQETDYFIRPQRKLIQATDANAEDDELELAAAIAAGSRTGQDGAVTQQQHQQQQQSQQQLQQQPQQHVGSGLGLGRVEYDMDEQDDMWLEALNAQRKANELEAITREIFEITITKIEKEWHSLEKRIPKPNPKPPQTHRPRSGSAAAVSGEPQVGEEQDSKCAICDDGDCENTNAIVFCDGCDLAVHQECYGVPFIPEGQWLCRKCQLIGRGVPTCIFCPNTDGAFKQTNLSKWAHLLCAMWIPEVSLGNHTFMEPVMDVDKVPRTRWKLSCYICNQKMGACIQCGNKACYQAFHVTCARRARLFLKMKTSQGTLAVLDGSMVLKAFCDRHCPEDYSSENAVGQATRDAKRFYKRAMRGRIWADSQAAASAIAASHRHAVTEHPPFESQMTGAKLSAVLGDGKKAQGGRPIWKLPSGAPVIPQVVFDAVEQSEQRFGIRKRKEFVADACRYWTLKREARRGAALLKRLQLQMETFSSMELTRRDFAAMGLAGRTRLSRRLDFAQNLVKDLEQLRSLSMDLVGREKEKLEAAELEQEFVDTVYFPIAKLLSPTVEKAVNLDKGFFNAGFRGLQSRLDRRFYTTVLSFVHDLCEVVNIGINQDQNSVPPQGRPAAPGTVEDAPVSPSKSAESELKERRKYGKKILKAVRPLLEEALYLESDVTHKPLDELLREFEGMLDTGLEIRLPPATITATTTDATTAANCQPLMEADDGSGDVTMVDVPVTVGVPIMGETGGPVKTEDNATDTSGKGLSEPESEGINNSEARTLSARLTVRGVPSAASSVAEAEMTTKAAADPSGASPDTVGMMTMAQPTPPTPPQSNGSLGREAPDPLSEGGVAWYLKAFDPRGTTVVTETWSGRDAVRSLSEELTDMDDEEMDGLDMDVDGDTVTTSAAATPAGAAETVDVLEEENRSGKGEGEGEGQDDDVAAPVATSSKSVKTRSSRSKKRARTSGRRR